MHVYVKPSISFASCLTRRLLTLGDLRENVISNVHKGCGPLDLSGMTAVSKNDGVNLFRPLLPLEKVSS